MHLGVLSICYIMGCVILNAIIKSVTMMTESAFVRKNVLLMLEMGNLVTQDVIHMNVAGMIINV